MLTIPSFSTRFRRLVPICFGLLLLSGCSLRQLAVNSLAGALGESADVFASDNDPQLVGEALPFALKTFEALIVQSPKNRKLLLATCEGFTQYSYAYVELELIQLELEDYRRYKEQRQRALNLYLRGRDYCLQALELEAPGITERLVNAPEDAVAGFGKDEVDLLFWTGSSWGAAIALGVDRPELIADLPAARAFLDKVLALDPDYGQGLIHEAFVVVESLPEAMGGSVERARQHYERALELSGGKRASVYVSWADLISYGQQNREEFVEMLEKALAVDADDEAVRDERLPNLIAQKRARILLSLVDDLFI